MVKVLLTSFTRITSNNYQPRKLACQANFRNTRKFKMGINNWKDLPTEVSNLMTQTLVITKNDTLFEKRLAIFSESADYTEDQIKTIRRRRENYLRKIGRDRRVFL